MEFFYNPTDRFDLLAGSNSVPNTSHPPSISSMASFQSNTQVCANIDAHLGRCANILAAVPASVGPSESTDSVDTNYLGNLNAALAAADQALAVAQVASKDARHESGASEHLLPARPQLYRTHCLRRLGRIRDAKQAYSVAACVPPNMYQGSDEMDLLWHEGTKMAMASTALAQPELLQAPRRRIRSARYPVKRVVVNFVSPGAAPKSVTGSIGNESQEDGGEVTENIKEAEGTSNMAIILEEPNVAKFSVFHGSNVWEGAVEGMSFPGANDAHDSTDQLGTDSTRSSAERVDGQYDDCLESGSDLGQDTHSTPSTSICDESGRCSLDTSRPSTAEREEVSKKTCGPPTEPTSDMPPSPLAQEEANGDGKPHHRRYILHRLIWRLSNTPVGEGGTGETTNSDQSVHQRPHSVSKQFFTWIFDHRPHISERTHNTRGCFWARPRTVHLMAVEQPHSTSSPDPAMIGTPLEAIEEEDYNLLAPEDRPPHAPGVRYSIPDRRRNIAFRSEAVNEIHVWVRQNLFQGQQNTPLGLRSPNQGQQQQNPEPQNPYKEQQNPPLGSQSPSKWQEQSPFPRPQQRLVQSGISVHLDTPRSPASTQQSQDSPSHESIVIDLDGLDDQELALFIGVLEPHLQHRTQAQLGLLPPRRLRHTDAKTAATAIKSIPHVEGTESMHLVRDPSAHSVFDLVSRRRPQLRKAQRSVRI